MALFPRTRHDLEAQRRLVADLLRPMDAEGLCRVVLLDLVDGAVRGRAT